MSDYDNEKYVYDTDEGWRRGDGFELEEGKEYTLYVIVKNKGDYTFKVLNPDAGESENGGESIFYVDSTGVCEFTVTESNFDGESGYGVEISFTTPAGDGNYILTLTAGNKQGELYESLDDYMAWASPILSTDEMGPGLTTTVGLRGKTEYKFYFTTGDLGDFTLTITAAE